MSTTAVASLNRAFSNKSVANSTFVKQQADYAADAVKFANSFDTPSVSNADLAKSVLTNLGILPSSVASVQALEGALANYFAVNGNRGFVVLQLANILATLEKATGDLAVYNTAAAAWNKEVADSVAYSGNAANTVDSDVAPQTIPLTTSADNVAPNAASQTIKGSVGLGGTTTLNATDTIDGGDGSDKLEVTLDANFSGFTTGSMKNVETLAVTSGGSAARTFDASGVTGVTTVDVAANKQGFSLIDLAAVGQTINLTGAGSNLTVAYTSAEVTKATTDALTVNVSDAGTSASSVMTVRAAGIETLNIGSGGTTGNFLDVAAGGTTKLVATGTNALQITAVDATLKSFDASAITGKVTADLRASTALTSVSTGTGDDSVTVADLGSPIAALAGGSGADTITFRGTAAATLQPALTGFETVAFRSIGGAITADFSKSSDVTTVRLVDGLAAALTTSGLTNAVIEFTQSEPTTTPGTNALTHAGTGSLTVSTATPGVDAKTYGAVTAARVDSVQATIGANTTIGAQAYATAQTVTQTVSGTLGDVTATLAESLTISADSTGVVQPVGSTNVLSAPAASTVSISASRSGTLGAIDLRADLAKTVTISGAGAIAYDNTTDLSSVTNLTVSTTGSYNDTGATIGDKSASVTYDASGVNGATTLNVANYTGTSTTASVVVKGSTIANNTIAVGTGHKSIDVTAGIGTNSITLGDLVAGTSTAPLTVKITSNGVAAGSDTLVFTTTAGAEDVSGLYSTVTLSGVDNIDLDAAGTLKMNAASVSGQTIEFTDDVNTLTLEGTTSADVINISKVTNAAADTIVINGGLGADSIVGHAGKNNITGDAGADTITGGTGVDTFIYVQTTEAGDTITDFTAADDTLQFTAANFGGGAVWTQAGALTAAGAAATDTYFEVTAAPTSTGVDLNANGNTTAGFVVVGAASGTAGVKVYFTTALGDFKTSNSTLIATLTGISTADISATDFVGV